MAPPQVTETPQTWSMRTYYHRTTRNTDPHRPTPELLQCNVWSVQFPTASPRHAKTRREATAAVSTALRTVGDVPCQCVIAQRIAIKRRIRKSNRQQEGSGAAVRAAEGTHELEDRGTEYALQTPKRVQDEGHMGRHRATRHV